MDQILAGIATAGNVAVLVLMVVCAGLLKFLKEERVLEREARREDAKACALSTDRQTAAVTELTKALQELRLDSARRKESA